VAKVKNGKMFGRSKLLNLLKKITFDLLTKVSKVFFKKNSFDLMKKVARLLLFCLYK
jgi:hypothetical protein